MHDRALADAAGSLAEGPGCRRAGPIAEFRHDLPDHRTHSQDAPSYDGLPRLRRGTRAAADFLPWLAGALAFLAPSVAGVRGVGLPLYRARHAWLRPFEHLCATRGLRAGADRAGHARAAGVAGARARGMDRP